MGGLMSEFGQFNGGLLMIKLAYKASEALHAGCYYKVYRYMLLAGYCPVSAIRRIQKDVREINQRGQK